MKQTNRVRQTVQALSPRGKTRIAALQKIQTRQSPSQLIAGILTFLVAMAGGAAAGPPQFSDFPATQTFNGPAVSPDNASAPPSWSAVGDVVKEIIREDMATGPNFAGTYYLAAVGCGSGCEAIFVIDVRDGRIHAAPEAASSGVLFRPHSRLIIIRENPFYDLSRTYLLFDQERFEVLE